VCYAGSEISYLIAKQLISGIHYISLVNLILDRKVVTELIQHDYTTQHLRDELRLITDDAANIARIKEDYRELDALLGDGSASAKAADVVLELAKRT
ncbi:MAG: lipid-A-disaccharide synthase, partial [Bacteroidales bacterium]|nr:lipid-A-disaccharide synthase [Bacteroidales bacterium]